jgi:hypothetical protein
MYLLAAKASRGARGRFCQPEGDGGYEPAPRQESEEEDQALTARISQKGPHATLVSRDCFFVIHNLAYIGLVNAGVTRPVAPARHSRSAGAAQLVAPRKAGVVFTDPS